jgi:hypothetical protein
MRKTYENVNLEKEIFCLLPWKRFIIDMSSIGFGCHGTKIDISKYSSCLDEVWNCEEMVKYRKEIIENREKACMVFLKNKQK